MNPHGGYRGKNKEVIDYSVNLNPLEHSDHMRSLYINSFDLVRNYPDIHYEKLTKALADHYQLPLEHVLPGNGSTELLYLAARVLRPQRVLIVSPTFNEYERAFRLAGSKVEHVILEEAQGFRLHMEAFKDREFDLLVLCNPNNPTGIYHGGSELTKLYELVREKKAKLFLDESFLDFIEEPASVRGPDVYRMRSLTKFYAIAGLRIGFLITEEKQRFIEHKEPWSINAIASEMTMQLLKDQDYRRRSLSYIERERERFCASLREDLLFGGDANFFLLRGKPQLAENLVKRGFYLRSCGDFQGLSKHDLRFCIGREEHNKRLIEALKEEGC